MTVRDIETWLNTDYDVLPPLQLSIMDAAAQAFTTHGFSAASVDLIAKEIGATKGSVYYHYRSKADLFFAVHKRAMVMNFRELLPLARAEEKQPAERLLSMAHAHAMLMMNHLFYQRVTVQGVEMHQSSSTTPTERLALEELVEMRDAYEDLFLKVLKEGVKKGDFADLDVRLAAKGILGALNWITVWYRPREGDTNAYKTKVAKQIARQVVSGVVPHG